MIESAKKAANEIKSKPKIMMVTILTSLNDESLKEIGNNNTVNEQVKKLAMIAKAAMAVKGSRIAALVVVYIIPVTRVSDVL